MFLTRSHEDTHIRTVRRWTLLIAATSIGLVACSHAPPSPSPPSPSPMSQAPLDSATIKKPALDRLASRQGALPPTFDEYLTQAAATEAGLAAADKALRAFKSGGKPPKGDDLVNVSRLLGLYTRLKYLDAVIATLAEMVAVPTVRGARPPHEDPNIVRIGELIGRVATQFGLQYRNVDNRIFEAKLPGSGAEEFGILTHADVCRRSPPSGCSTGAFRWTRSS